MASSRPEILPAPTFETYLVGTVATFKSNYMVAPEALKVVSLLQEWQALVKRILITRDPFLSSKLYWQIELIILIYFAPFVFILLP